MEDKLLRYCYLFRDDYIAEVGLREFDCLIYLVEEGNVTTFEQLAEYGMEY